MHAGRRVPFMAAVAVLALALAGGCKQDDGPTDNNGEEFEPAKAQAYLARNFAKIGRITEGLQRVILTANNPAQPQPGVSFLPLPGGTGFQGTVGVDLDGDGSRESTVNARVTLTNPAQWLAGGADLVVTGITTPSLQSASVNAHVRLPNPAQVEFTSGSATLVPTQGPRLTISDANLTATPTFTSPLILGTAEFQASGKSGTAIFEPNGSGGFRLRIASTDFTGFTVP